jgi:hypothetical protein
VGKDAEKKIVNVAGFWYKYKESDGKKVIIKEEVAENTESGESEKKVRQE